MKAVERTICQATGLKRPRRVHDRRPFVGTVIFKLGKAHFDKAAVAFRLAHGEDRPRPRR